MRNRQALAINKQLGAMMSMFSFCSYHRSPRDASGMRQQPGAEVFH
jgi:hypothetical protein